MKKLSCIILIVSMILAHTACNSKEIVITNSTSQTVSTSQGDGTVITSTEPISSYDGIDVDLTVLSSTMVFSEVYNMVYTPEDYIGKTVRMQGQFAASEPMENGQRYFACVIADAAACCQQGLEFVLAFDDLSYPEDYPESGSEIIVTGVFQTYTEGEYTYCHLVDSELVTLD